MHLEGFCLCILAALVMGGSISGRLHLDNITLICASGNLYTRFATRLLNLREAPFLNIYIAGHVSLSLSSLSLLPPSLLHLGRDLTHPSSLCC
ncbi:hypothetical protein F4809DRAFT_626926 [Biscogniauxia mediterranea]|nr:hypothetical protein F4809DRAFT_626926 [Biscogniauxia mediterranea]